MGKLSDQQRQEGMLLPVELVCNQGPEEELCAVLDLGLSTHQDLLFYTHAQLV